MITSISVKNYKSIENLTLDLGRVNVFIGENGAGKSNILESIALAGAAAADKLDSEFLVSRGIRATDSRLMCSAFESTPEKQEILIDVEKHKEWFVRYQLQNDGEPYSKWLAEIIHLMRQGDSDFKKEHDHIASLRRLMTHSINLRHKEAGKDVVNKPELERQVESLMKFFLDSLDSPKNSKEKKAQQEMQGLRKAYLQEAERKNSINSDLASFIIYSPENSALRDFSKEGQVQPLGISGEGLFKLLKIQQKDESFKNDLTNFLHHFGWFETIEIPDDASHISHIKAIDKFIKSSDQKIDLRSTNEGFLFLAFYFALFKSKLTPRFFAIDNVDASLNPKLCRVIMSKMNRMAKENDKQVLLTTHNPAILDGLDLGDPDQRLFVVSRNEEGRTAVRRVQKPEPVLPGRTPRLSTMFMDGVLGGLPKFF